MTRQRGNGAVRVVSDETVAGMLPPHDLEAEAAVIASVIIDGKRIDDVADIVKAEDFFSEANRQIYTSMLELRESGSPIDVVTIASRLKASERLSQVGGWAYLTGVQGDAPFVANVRTYAETVARRSLARSVIKTAQRIVAMGYVDHGDDAEFASRSAQELHDIAYRPQANDVELVGGPLETLAREIGQAAATGKGMLGTKTGFDSYDLRLAGLHDGDLTIIAARPGVGKTSLALGMALNLGLRGEPSIIFSLEMPRKQVALRLACMLESLDSAKVRSGNMNAGDFQKLTAAVVRIKQLPIWVDDTPGITALDMRTKLRRVAAEEHRKGRRLKLAVFDYLQLGHGPEEAREQVIAQLAQGMKDAAKEANVAVVALSQLNREVEKRAKGRPQLSDLRESGNIEQAADNIVFVWGEDGKPNEKKLTLAKQRNGPTSEWEMKWTDTYSRFDDFGMGEVEERRYVD